MPTSFVSNMRRNTNILHRRKSNVPAYEASGQLDHSFFLPPMKPMLLDLWYAQVTSILMLLGAICIIRTEGLIGSVFGIVISLGAILGSFPLNMNILFIYMWTKRPIFSFHSVVRKSLKKGKYYH